SLTTFNTLRNLAAPSLSLGSGAGVWSSQRGEGLPSSHWKPPANFVQWTAPYATGTSFNTTFGVTQETGLTLLGALQRTGTTGLQALAREGVAALLNAASPSITFAFSVAQVLAMVEGAYADPSIV